MTLKTVLGFALVALSLAWTFGPRGTSPALSAPAPRAVATVTLTPAPPSGNRTYVVEPGDSFWTIAEKLYGDGSKYRLIINANQMSENTRLQIGQILTVPPVPDRGLFVPTVSFTAGPTSVYTPVPSLDPGTIQAATTRVVTAPPRPTISLGSSAAASPASNVLPPELVSSIATPDVLRVLDILSGILAGSSVVCAFFAYQAYLRAQRLERMMRVRRRSRVQL